MRHEQAAHGAIGFSRGENQIIIRPRPFERYANWNREVKQFAMPAYNDDYAGRAGLNGIRHLIY